MAGTNTRCLHKRGVLLIAVSVKRELTVIVTLNSHDIFTSFLRYSGVGALGVKKCSLEGFGTSCDADSLPSTGLKGVGDDRGE